MARNEKGDRLMFKLFFALVIGIAGILIVGYIATFILFAAVDSAKRER
jgi:hypothetical protein